MKKQRTNIVVLEQSDIIYEGLSNIILKINDNCFLYRVNDIDELISTHKETNYNTVIANPMFIQNKDSDFLKYKTNHPKTLFLGIEYSVLPEQLINKFDNTININDSANIVSKKIINNANIKNINEIESEELTQREIEVLICLTEGKANKEIAEELNISIHTVISHRKNIIEKTGIKSLSGLTIYAISKNIIHLK